MSRGDDYAAIVSQFAEEFGLNDRKAAKLLQVVNEQLGVSAGL